MKETPIALKSSLAYFTVSSIFGEACASLIPIRESLSTRESPWGHSSVWQREVACSAMSGYRSSDTLP